MFFEVAIGVGILHALAQIMGSMGASEERGD